MVVGNTPPIQEEILVNGDLLVPELPEENFKPNEPAQVKQPEVVEGP